MLHLCHVASTSAAFHPCRGIAPGRLAGHSSVWPAAAEHQRRSIYVGNVPPDAGSCPPRSIKAASAALFEKRSKGRNPTPVRARRGLLRPPLIGAGAQRRSSSVRARRRWSEQRLCCALRQSSVHSSVHCV
jgi:hypothetical protein